MDAPTVNNCKEVYRRCLHDIEDILKCFDGSGCCIDVASARQGMAQLKANWKERIKGGKGTDVESVVGEALTRIEVRSNSSPSQKWLDDLYSARVDLDFYLGH